MAIQQVDKRLLSELEAMGFSEAQARKGLHQSGNLSIEAAVNWIVDNENDAATHEMPMCPQDPINIDIEEVNPSLISEKVKLCAQELRNGSSKRKAEGKKKLERETEKVERRVGLGLPLEDATSTKPATSLLQGTSNSSTDDSAVLPVKPAEKAELLRECLRSMKHKNKEDNEVIRAFGTLLIYVRNVFTNPEEGKFRKIRISNPAFQDRVGKFEDAIRFLELCGFERVEGGNFLFLPREKVDMRVLKLAGAQLQNALTNPFFGLLSK